MPVSPGTEIFLHQEGPSPRSMYLSNNVQRLGTDFRALLKWLLLTFPKHSHSSPDAWVDLLGFVYKIHSA